MINGDINSTKMYCVCANKHATIDKSISGVPSNLLYLQNGICSEY